MIALQYIRLINTDRIDPEYIGFLQFARVPRMKKPPQIHGNCQTIAANLNPFCLRWVTPSI
jgi:hypothetical protein